MNHILYQIVDDLAIITLNRPEVANGFHIPMCEEILEALTLAEQDQAVQFILINANGKVFSVGGDLVEMKRAVDEDDIPSFTSVDDILNRSLNLYDDVIWVSIYKTDGSLVATKERKNLNKSK